MRGVEGLVNGRRALRRRAGREKSAPIFENGGSSAVTGSFEFDWIGFGGAPGGAREDGRNGTDRGMGRIIKIEAEVGEEHQSEVARYVV
jgi:hypothetical protein